MTSLSGLMRGPSSCGAPCWFPSSADLESPRCQAAHSQRLEGQLCLSIVPIDDLEKHSALKHFGLQISGVLFPVWGFPNAKSGVLIETDLAHRRMREHRGHPRTSW